MPVSVPAVMIGVRDRAEGDRRRVGEQDHRRRPDRREAQRHQHHAGDRHRGAEPGEGLQQPAEAERDDDGLEPRVVGDVAERPRAGPRSAR